jgi:hypothetical protein
MKGFLKGIKFLLFWFVAITALRGFWMEGQAARNSQLYAVVGAVVLLLTTVVLSVWELHRAPDPEE